MIFLSTDAIGNYFRLKMNKYPLEFLNMGHRRLLYGRKRNMLMFLFLRLALQSYMEAPDAIAGHKVYAACNHLINRRDRWRIMGA